MGEDNFLAWANEEDQLAVLKLFSSQIEVYKRDGDKADLLEFCERALARNIDLTKKCRRCAWVAEYEKTASAGVAGQSNDGQGVVK